MTVLDTSGLVDYLLSMRAAEAVAQLIRDEGELAAPDVLVFETLATLRRRAFRGQLDDERATSAVADLRDAPLVLVPTLPLRQRAWELRRNFTAGDALFVALAEGLREPLATADRALVDAAHQVGVSVVALVD